MEGEEDVFPFIDRIAVTYQLLSTNKAAHKSPFLAVYEPGRGGLLLSSL